MPAEKLGGLLLVTPRLGFSLPHACNSMSFKRSGTRPPQALLSRTSIAAWARSNIALCTKCLRCNVAVVVWPLVLLPLLCFGADSPRSCRNASLQITQLVWQEQCGVQACANANTLTCAVSHVRPMGLAGQRKCARHRAACTSVVVAFHGELPWPSVKNCETSWMPSARLSTQARVCWRVHTFASNVNFGVRHKIMDGSRWWSAVVLAATTMANLQTCN